MGLVSTSYNYNNPCPSQTIQTIDNSQSITFQHHEQDQHLFELSQQNYETLFFPSQNETYLCEDQLIDSTFSCDQKDDFVSLNEIFPNDEDFNYVLPCAKRQKLGYEETIQQQQQQQQRYEPQEFCNSANYFVQYEQQELFNSANYLVDEFIANPFTSEAFSASNMVDVVKCEKKVSERTISTQSIAARERRRKITEKTQQLGKLVPGGHKMNTAEMLNAAANYVRFLQAQVGMLQVMETFSKEEKEPPPSEDLHKLVVSPFVQEKLYSEEKCFISKEIITTLTNNVDVRSKLSILQGLKQIVGSEIDHEKKPKQE